ncbi:hypothetical protein CC80DRAFT_540233, partial [Byssothecium circinans]
MKENSSNKDGVDDALPEVVPNPDHQIPDGRNAVFTINAFTWGVLASYGIYLAYYLPSNHFPSATSLDFAFIGGLNFSIAMIVATPVTYIVRTIGTHPLMFFVVVLQTSGFVAASFATKIWHLYLSQGVCESMGVGFLFIPSAAVTSQWFDRKRGLANSINSAGSGFGGIIISFATEPMIDHLSLAWSLRIIGILSGTVNIIASRGGVATRGYREDARGTAMLLAEGDKPAVKQWLLPKLESISDAEPEVLADYVIALLSAAGSADAVKKSSADALSDFLADRALPFVEEVVTGIEQRKWAGTHHVKMETAQPIKSESAPVALEHIPSIAGSSNKAHNSAPTTSAGGRMRARTARASKRAKATENVKNAKQRARTRKRKLEDKDAGENQDGPDGHSNKKVSGRPAKQLARQAPLSGPSSLPTTTRSIAAPPTLPKALPRIGFSNPTMLTDAMASRVGMGLPNHSGLGTPVTGYSLGMPSLPQNLASIRCVAYDTVGFCLLGPVCPYDHSTIPTEQDALVQEYDPKHPLLNGRKAGIHIQASKRAPRAGRAQAPTSHLGTPNDLNNKSLVVEQIPQDHFSEEHVRAFFSEFGKIVDVKLQEHKRRAIVEFRHHDSVQRAYDNPKIIFDNRFVKVHWHDAVEGPSKGRYRTVRVGNTFADQNVPEIYKENEEDMIDWEVFEQQQAEAQAAFEERRKKEEEKFLLDTRIQEQLYENKERIDELRRKLAEKARARGEEEIGLIDQEHASDVADSLSSLYAEAAGLYAQYGSDQPSNRGQRMYRGRARGRGAYRGRGTHRSSVKRLDNRPKRIGIHDVVAGSQRDIDIRSHLRHVLGCEDVQPHRGRPNVLIAGFSERWQADMFLDEVARIPTVGTLQLSWIPNGESVVVGSPEQEPFAIKREGDKGIVIKDEDQSHHVIKIEDDSWDEADLDVADDTDRWV